MNSGFYSACAALIARTHSLDISANNLANVSTVGFRSQQPSFRSVLLTNRSGEVQRAVNEFAAIAPERAAFSAGRVERTGNDLDVALDGPGFLTVQTRAGVRYTRDGRLQVSPEGILVNLAGDPVLGKRGAIHTPGGQLSISDDGTVSVNGAVVDRLSTVEFASTESLIPNGNSYFAADAAAAKPAIRTSVSQGALERSNVDPIGAAVGLIALQRHAEMMQRALAIFHSDFNRIAAEEIPRV